MAGTCWSKGLLTELTGGASLCGRTVGLLTEVARRAGRRGARAQFLMTYGCLGSSTRPLARGSIPCCLRHRRPVTCAPVTSECSCPGPFDSQLCDLELLVFLSCSLWLGIHWVY